jgi:hypothetical protein
MILLDHSEEDEELMEKPLPSLVKSIAAKNSSNGSYNRG